MRVTINLNGDTRETLSKELWDILNAADALRQKIGALTVNGRNYPDNPDGLRADQEDKMLMAKMAEEVRRWAQNGLLQLNCTR